ncbi:amidase [Pararcticibacter amylolyticus]|uniref:amidase n=1 Tax=Pararcticibacter amylolyticus TaxID=2173175 RepID=UPI001304E69C|nr:amidase [Pararcticibacter amylolyticus]
MSYQIFTLVEFERWLAGQKVSRLIKLIQNHHTWKPNYKSFAISDGLSLLKSMENAHLERGFSAIAQQFTTFPDGTIGTGRPLDMMPAGIKGANRNGICMEHVGNFDTGGDQMNQTHRNTIIKLNALLCRKFSLVPSDTTIVYHHWYDLNTGERTKGAGTTKTCPGTNFFGGNTVGDFQRNFLPLVVDQIKNQDTAEPVSFKFAAQVTAEKLNVRNANSLNAPIVAKLTKGTEVRVFGENDGWYAINASYSRWVKKEYVKPTS